MEITYRILITDDEKNERDCIRFLIEDKALAPMEILEAEDGICALEILDRHPVDILFTDIRMPRMDGLELIRSVIKRYPSMKLIIFSGYADFAYAQKAITLGVDNYILKPIVPKELYATLSSLIDQLEEERNETLQKQKQQSFLLQYALHLSISGNFDRNRADPYVLEQLPLFGAMIMLDFPNGFLETYYTSFYESLRRELTLDLESLNLSPSQALLFLRGVPDDLKALCQTLLAHIRQNFHTDACLSAVCPLSRCASLKDAYNAAEQQLEQRFWQPNRHIFLAEDAASRRGSSDPADADETARVQAENSDSMDEKRLLAQIKNALAAKNADLLRQYTDSLFARYRIPGMQSQIYTKFIFSNLLTTLYPYVPEMTAKKLPALEILISELYLQPDISKIIQSVSDLLKPILDEFSLAPACTRRETLDALSYIEKHYGEELSVETLASRVYLTPDYLSRLFKKDVGKSISQYIRQFRMEKAKELLLRSNRKVIDVGVQVGYPNYSYFCQSFREFYGSSPEKYRQEHAV